MHTKTYFKTVFKDCSTLHPCTKSTAASRLFQIHSVDSRLCTLCLQAPGSLQIALNMPSLADWRLSST